MIKTISWKLILLMCLTLGLVPFFPEPHLWGKLKWIWGGAIGMKPIDWFDVLLHGAPFILLLWKSIWWLLRKK